MVIVVCAAALLTAFALAMVYAAGLLLSRANRRLEQERSYQLAKSFAQVLDKELKAYASVDHAPDDSFYRYAYNFLEGRYGDYDPAHPEETVFHYTAASPSGMDSGKYGKIRVALYKEGNQGTDDSMSGEISAGQNPAGILNNRLQRYNFTVEVTAEVDGVTYRYSTEYRQMAAYHVVFRHNQNLIVWDESRQKWHQNSLAGEEYTDWGGANIQYEFQSDSSSITSCVFENAYAEGDAHE